MPSKCVSINLNKIRNLSCFPLLIRHGMGILEDTPLQVTCRRPYAGPMGGVVSTSVWCTESQKGARESLKGPLTIYVLF